MPIHDWTRVDAGIFHAFHMSWLSHVMKALNAGLLPSGYYALVEQATGSVGPDVLTRDLNPPGPPRPQAGTPASPAASGAVSLTASSPKVRFTTVEAESHLYARRRRRVAIRHSSGHEVVAMIEIVSPGNKASRHMLRSFVAKAVEVLEAGVHLLIVDLFPPGPRDPQGIHAAIWSEMEGDEFQLPPDKRLTLVSYSADALKRAFIEPVAFGDVLPDMPLFLEPELYVHVPLEATYQSAWEGVPQFWRDQLGATGPTTS